MLWDDTTNNSIVSPMYNSSQPQGSNNSWQSLNPPMWNSQTGTSPYQTTPTGLPNNSVVTPLSPDVQQDIETLLQSLRISRDDISLQFRQEPEPNSMSQNSLMYSNQQPSNINAVNDSSESESEEIQLERLKQSMENMNLGGQPIFETVFPELTPTVFETVLPPTEMELTKSQSSNALQKIINSKKNLRNEEILPGFGKSLDTIGNLLEKNMQLKKAGVTLNTNRIIYQQWDKMVYLGGLMFEDEVIISGIKNNSIDMTGIVQFLIIEQNKMTNKSGLSAVSKDFIRDLLFTGGENFKKIRDQVYGSKKSSSVSQMGAAGGPVSGKGLKHTGLKTVKQIISRTENLIQSVNLGNKSKEVRNELDTLLAVLIDKKQIRPEFRSNLMKKLF